MIIIALTLSALVITAVALAPINPVNFSQQNQISRSNLNKLNLIFYTNIGEVNVYTNLTGSNMLLMNVTATGATSLFGSNQPVTFMVQNRTDDNSQLVTAQVTSQTSFPFDGNLHVVCNIYVNPEADLTLNVRSDVGDVRMNADSNATFSSLILETTTGSTMLNLQEGTAVNGDLRLSTATGNVQLTMNQADVNGNYTIELNTGTGDITMNILQTRRFNGNLQINGQAGTGSITVSHLQIDGEVAARIQSNTGVGQIITILHNFNGNQSPVQSNNYPAKSNINMNFNTGVGNIRLNAAYQATEESSLRA
jgi:hypothetical protein